jgi:WD40 repeat protein
MVSFVLLATRSRPRLLQTAVAGLVLVVATSRLARGDHPAAPGDAPADTARFLRRAMPIGNLGSITPNARRYALSPDWATLAAPQDSGSIVMFDVASGQPAPPLEGGFKVGTFTYTQSDRVPSCEFGFSSDGRFVVWTWGKKVVAWEVSTREIVLKREIDALRDGAVHFSPDRQLVTWSTSDGLTVWSLSRRAAEVPPGREHALWALDRTGRVLAKVPLPQDVVQILARRMIADVALPADGFYLWNVASGGMLSSDPASGPEAWSADGRYYASVNEARDVVIRDEGSPGQPARTLPGREKGNHGRCTTWDAEQGWGPPQLLLSREGRVLADSCRLTDIWDLSQPVPMLLLRTGLLRTTAGRPVLSTDGRTLAYSWGGGSRLGGDGGFGLVDVPSAKPFGPAVEVKYLGAMMFSPDGSSLATAGWVPRPGVKQNYEVQIWSVDGLRSGTPAP